MKLLVTGAAGRLGRNLERSLREAGDFESVFVRHRPLPGGPAEMGGLDVTDRAAVTAKIAEVQPDVIVHLASIAGASCDVDPARTQAVNVDSVRWVSEAASQNGVGRIVFASTGGVYGERYDAPIAESGPIDIQTKYAASKFEAEEVLRAASNGSSAIQTVILRIFNVYGPGFDESLVSRLLASSRNTPARLIGLSHFVRDYSHVSAVVAAIESSSSAFLSETTTTLNIGSGVPLSNLQLLELLGEWEGIEYLVQGDAISYSCADIDAAKAILDFSPSIPAVDLKRRQLR